MSVAHHARDLVTDVLLSFSSRAANAHTGHNHADHSGHNHADHSGHNHPPVSSTIAKAGGCVSKGCVRGWKIGFAIVLFLEGLLFGYVALLLKRFGCMSTKSFRRLLHYINAGGGGVFLATGLLHILPEAVEIFKEKGSGHGAHGHAIEFPTPYAIGLATFLLFLLFDRVLFPGSHDHGDQDVKADPSRTSEDVDETSNPRHVGPKGYEDFDVVVVEEDREVDFENQDKNNASVTSSTFSMSGSRPLNGFKSAAFATAGITTAGIAAHSLFESVALGSATKFSTALNVFIAISTHRWATSMALGSRYMNGDLNVAAYSVLTVLFSLVTPLGVLIGFGAQSLSYVFQGTVFAISAGTFIYIGAFETVAHEFVAHTKYMRGKFIIMVAGAALMTLITGILVITKVH